MLLRADVVKVSSDDLEFIAPDDHPAGVQKILDGGATLVLHTDGGRSVHIHSDTDDIEVPVPPVEVIDTIGAGDSFGGAFVAWWDQAGLGRHDLQDLERVTAAVTAAVEVSAVSCTRVGAQPPRRAELGARWDPTPS
jgi:fructokinase